MKISYKNRTAQLVPYSNFCIGCLFAQYKKFGYCTIGTPFITVCTLTDKMYANTSNEIFEV